MNNYPNITYPTPAIRDLHTVGINPLRCVICQKNRKLENKMTCGEQQCIQQFFEQNVKPDLSEERRLG